MGSWIAPAWISREARLPKPEPLFRTDCLYRPSKNGSMTHQANYTLALLRCLHACAQDIRRQLDSLDAYLAMTQGSGGCNVHPFSGDKRPRKGVPFNDNV
jgi:hypothetical protein